MAQLTYNGVEFSMIHVLSYSQEAVYDPTNTDYLFTKVAIQVAAVMSYFPPDDPATAVFLPPSERADGSVAETMVRVRQDLETPRKQLTFVDADNVVVSHGSATTTPSDGSQFDVKNGPFPRVSAITRFDGTTTFHVTFSIETYILECPSSNAIPILSHRWREQIDIDKVFTMGYKRSGTLIVRADQQAKNADVQGRPSTYVPLRNGFARERSHYELSEDGLILRYTIEDRQQYRMVPFPALKATGTRTESYSTNWTTLKRATSISLEGPPDAKQSDLMNMGLFLAMQQVYYPAIQTGIILGASVTLGVWANTVEIKLEVQVTPGNVANGATENGVPTKAYVAAAAAVATRSLGPLTVFALASGGSNGAAGGKAPASKGAAVGPMFTKMPGMNGKRFASKLYTDPNAKMPVPTLFGSPGDPTYNNQTAAQLTLLAAALGIPCRVPPPPANINKAVNVFNAAVQAVAAALDGQNAQVTGLSAKDFEAIDPPVLFATEVGIFTDYVLKSYYGDDANIIQMPNSYPAGGQPIASICQWAAPMDQVIVEWSATKVGEWPTVPSPKSADTNLVYQRGFVSPDSAVLRGDATTGQYTLAGKYYYAVIDPTKLVARAGLMPWIVNTGGAISTSVPPGVFTEEIMNPPASGGSPGSGPQFPNIKSAG